MKKKYEQIKLSKKSQEAAALYVHAREGSRKAQFEVSESIARGDFAKPLEPVLAAQISKVYHETESNVEAYTTPKTVQGIDRPEPIQAIVISDADQSNIPDSNMGDRWIPGTLPSVGPREKYPEIGLAPFYEKTISASKVGEAFAIDWEAVVNSRGGEIDLIDQAVTAFGKHAKQTGDVRALKRLVNRAGTGWSPAVTSMGRVIPGNPDFSDIEVFVTALEEVRDTPVVIDGNEQTYDSFTMLVAPGMKAKYDRMLNARAFTRIPAPAAEGDYGLQYQIDIAVPVTINVVETKWLRQLYPTIGKGYILIPNGDGNYPVLTLNKLNGYTEPSFWVKDSNAREYRGGDVPVLTEGDFDSDAIETKVRWVLGSDLLWGDGILFSSGQNTA